MGEQRELLPKLLSVANLAERYEISERSVLRLARAGTLPSPVNQRAKSKQWHPDVIARFEQGSADGVPLASVTELEDRRVS